ncbi:YobI family P-loop NTPase [Eisenbergiella sp.]|uniref:YobI family P-loop NTPase n=1 Tax=Eisenbergiella sp. TaxID=1924109 RepID=UPI003FA410CF
MIFEGGFLQGLSLYIVDMCLLKNINNEFVVYFNQLIKALVMECLTRIYYLQ